MGTQLKGDSLTAHIAPHERRQSVTPVLLAANNKLGLCGGHCRVGKGNSGEGGRQGGSIKSYEEKYSDKSKDSTAKALTVVITLNLEETSLVFKTHGN